MHSKLPTAAPGVFLSTLLACAALSTALSANDDVRLGRLQDDGVRLLQEYLQIDTTNPPGNESRAVEFFARILEQEGIPYETAESAPGRGNLWARLEGGDEPALVLLHHTDVVPADPRFWTQEPLSGALRDGYLYGRGALDTKGLGILHLQAFLALHRSGRPLRRDVIFMATADEEAGGLLGVGWLIANRPALFDNVGLVLNEGGGGMTFGSTEVFNIEVTQKVPLWLRLSARGVPGHGSTPLPDSAVSRLLRALARLDEYEFEERAVAPVARYFRGLAAAVPAYRDQLENIELSVRDLTFVDALERRSPQLHALLRNTCSITRLEGSTKINVVPPEASAEIDCRLLPDQDPDEFLAELEEILREPSLTIERLMSFSPAISSTDTELYRVLEAVTREHFPDSLVLPSVVAGFTDSHFFRDLGITSYGFRPSLLTVEEAGTVHGNDERVALRDLRLGVAMMVEILERITLAEARAR